MMSKGISVNYGNLQISTPAIVMPVSSQIGSMSNAVVNKLNASETSPFSGSTTQAYDTINALMQNNKSYQAQQAAANSSFNKLASQDAEYQANAISHQGKK